jgi:hypothetical protein
MIKREDPPPMPSSSPTSNSYHYPSPETCRIISLWQAVIAQAFRDLYTNSKKRNTLNNTYYAKAWFDEANEDLKFVCLLANLEPDYVLRKAKELQKNKTRLFQ